MSFSGFLQNELQNLSSEAKKKNPEIKDAVERLLITLKTLKDVPEMNLPRELAKDNDVIVPFLMSLESRNPKLVMTSISCIQKLISHQGLPVGSIGIVINRMADQAGGPMELQLKILQTILPLVMNYPSVVGSCFADSLLLCLKLQETKSPIINTTAAVTFRQLIVHAYERLSLADSELDAQSVSISGDLVRPEATDAFMLFQDLSVLASNEEGVFLKSAMIDRGFALELLEAVISSQPILFSRHSELLNLLKQRICPLIIKSFSDKNNFPDAVRLVRLVQVLIKHLHKSLLMECEIFLSIYNKLLQGDNTPLWQKVLILEAHKALVADAKLQVSLFSCYDHANSASHTFGDMILDVGRFLFSARTYLTTYPEDTKSDGGLTNESFALVISEASNKVQLIDQLDKNEPPPFPETYPMYVAVQFVFNLTSAQHNSIVPSLTKSPDEMTDSESVLLSIELVKISAPTILACLVLLLSSSIDDDLFTLTLREFQNATVLVGLLGLTSFRDAFFGYLCRACTPIASLSSIELSTMSKDITPFIIHSLPLNGRSESPAFAVLSDRNVGALKTLLVISETLISVIDNRMWYAIFETLQMSETLLTTGKMGKRMESSPGMIDGNSPMAAVGLGGVFRGRALTTSTTPAAMTNQVAASADNNFQAVVLQTKRLFERSVVIDQKHLVEFMRALCRLGTDTMGGSGLSNGKEKTDEKSFAIGKIHLVTLLIIKKLLQDFEYGVWDMIIFQLTTIAQSPNCSSTVRAQVCLVFGEILLSASQNGNLSDERVERRVLEPIGSLVGFDSSSANPEDKSTHLKGAWFIDVQRSGIETLNKVLQTSGQSFTAGWVLIMNLLTWVARTSKLRRRLAESPDSEASMGNSNKTVIRVAFPCVQLVCADFLPLLPPVVLLKCIETVSAYGHAGEDLNMSLSSVGLLWTICDYILSKRHQIEKNKDEEQAFKPRESVTKLEMPVDTLKLIDMSTLEGPFTIQSIDTLWMFLLGNLSELCSDERTEVRNSANQTLFRTLEMKGAKLTTDAWKLCIKNVLMPLLDRIQSSFEKATEPHKSQMDLNFGSPSMKPQSPNMTMNTSKSWDETKILTLNGVTKCITDFLPRLLPLESVLQQFWEKFLGFISSNCLSGSPEVTIASVKTFKTLIGCGKSLDAESTEKWRMELLELANAAWDEWISVGERIVLHSITKTIESENLDLDHGPSGILFSDGTNRSIIEGYIAQDALNTWLSIFFLLHEQIQTVFGLNHVKRLYGALLDLLLYQSLPVPGASSRYRDVINDLDNPSPFQATVLEIVALDKVPFEKLDFIVETTLSFLGDMVKLPFVTSPLPLGPPSLPVDTPPNKKFTYMALSKKTIEIITFLFEKHGSKKSIYDLCAFDHCLKGLGVSMKQKYGCPASSTKEPSPLWKSATTSAFSILKTGLASVETYRAEFSIERAREIHQVVTTLLYDFLLNSSRPQPTITPEELGLDDAFDAIIVEDLASDLVFKYSREWVSDDLLVSFLELFHQGTKLYTQPAKIASLSNSSSMANVLDESPIKNDVPILGSDIIPLGREPFAFGCLRALFDLSSNIIDDKSELRDRISSLAAPILLRHLKSRIDFYVSERPNWGSYPLPRIMRKELSVCLKSILDLELRPKTLLAAFPEINDDLVKQKLYSGTSAHLFVLYGSLCNLLSVYGSYSVTGIKVEEDDETLLLKKCLSRILPCIGSITL